MEEWIGECMVVFRMVGGGVAMVFMGRFLWRVLGNRCGCFLERMNGCVEGSCCMNW